MGRGYPLPIRLGSLGSVVSSPSGVRDRRTEGWQSRPYQGILSTLYAQLFLKERQKFLIWLASIEQWPADKTIQGNNASLIKNWYAKRCDWRTSCKTATPVANWHIFYYRLSSLCKFIRLTKHGWSGGVRSVTARGTAGAWTSPLSFPVHPGFFVSERITFWQISKGRFSPTLTTTWIYAYVTSR